MALVKCKECGTQISSSAKTCPSCGKAQTKSSTKVIGGLFIVMVVLLVWGSMSDDPALPPPTAAERVSAACNVSDIAIKSMQAKFVDSCRLTPCFFMEGVAVLTNHCPEPVGVQIKITAYDEPGSPLATREFWPASVRNIPPGDYTFTLDQALDYDPRIKTFELQPVDVRHWR